MTIYLKQLKKITKFSWNDFPVLTGKTAREQAHIRNLMQFAVQDDLLGPAGGPEEEIIGMSVRDRYLVGKLAPIDVFQEEEHRVVQLLNNGP